MFDAIKVKSDPDFLMTPIFSKKTGDKPRFFVVKSAKT